MHEINYIELELKIFAEELSEKFNGAPIVIIVGDSKEAKIKRTMTATSGINRLRNLLDVLESSIHTESWKHFQSWECNTSYTPRHFVVVSKLQTGGLYVQRSQGIVEGKTQACRT